MSTDTSGYGESKNSFRGVATSLWEKGGKICDAILDWKW